jgi:ankyrin repeat protein
VQDDPTENEQLWPLKVVFTRKPPKKERPFKFFHPSRYENLSPQEKLHAAACDDNADLIEQLAKKGVDLNAPRQDGQTALDACAWSGSTVSAEALLDVGADPAVTVQALCGAASWGHAELLEAMLAKGGKVNQEHGNYTSLQWAINQGHEDCAVVLQKHDAIALEDNQAAVIKKARRGGMSEFLQMVAQAHPDLAQDCVIRAGDRCSIM